MIYFILNPDANVVKIGYTRKDVENRLSNLQVGNHAELKLIGVINGTAKHEKYYHRLFSEYHTKGEWFTYGEKLQEFVENIDETTEAQIIETNEGLDEKVAYINLGKNKIANLYLNNQWYRKIEANAYQLLLELLVLENYRTGEIVVNAKNRNIICERLDCSISHVSRGLVNLLDNNVIVKIQRGVYMVNPLKMCIGKKTAQKNKLDKYMKYANLKVNKSA